MKPPVRLVIALVGVALWSSGAVFASSAPAQTTQNAILVNPGDAAQVDAAKGRGATAIKLIVSWYHTSPGAQSCTAPSGINLSDPASYNWNYNNYDAIITRAVADGLPVYLTIGGGFPCYASADPQSCSPQPPASCTLNPNLYAYAAFVSALAHKYPFANRWSPYNEPDANDTLTVGTGTQSKNGVRQAALIYRQMWTLALPIIRNAGSAAPLWFGETTRHGAETYVGDSAGFIETALCLGNFVSQDSRYASCGSSPQQIDAEALSFHPYETNPADGVSVINDFDYVKYVATSLGRLRSGAYIASSEFGIHNGTCWPSEADCQKIVDQGLYDPTNARTETVGAAYVNCTEEGLYNNSSNVSTSQYLMNDGPSPSAGSNGQWYTGLRHGDGSPKQSFNAWQMPISVWRQAADGRLHVWGAVRPQPVLNGNVKVVAVNGTYTAYLSVNSRGYFNGVLSGAPSGYKWQSLSGSTLRSRVAGGSDCGAGWQGGS